MSHIFSLGDIDDFSEKIDMDELYEKKKELDLSKLEIFNKLLARIHKKIKMTSRQQVDIQYCWFIVPEVMIGVPRYNHSDCIAYLMEKLQKNGFFVKYTHPNLLLISWKHWIPDYVRTEIKKKTNINIDGYGNVIEDKPKTLSFSMNSEEKKPSKKEEEFKSLGIYDIDLFKNLK
jgi:hypothetical protein